MPKLGINIDHIATLREARGEDSPDPLRAVPICEKAGCDSIVAHLREDRRHINDRDIKRLRKKIRTRFNLEMSLALEIVHLALRSGVDQVTIVPERRQEVTTEGGLDVIKNKNKLGRILPLFKEKKIAVSIFIDPDFRQIEEARRLGIGMLELHTGRYAKAKTETTRKRELKILSEAAGFARNLGMIVNAGHGLNYTNTRAVARIKGIEELNIGHAIISRAVFVGIEKAIQEMLRLTK